MFCEECGSELSENVKFCPKCGCATGAGATSGQQGSAASNNAAQAEMAQNNTAQAGMAQNNAAQAGMAQNNAAQGGMAHNNTAQGGMAQNNAAQAGVAQNNAAQGGMAQNSTVQAGMAQNNAAQAGMAQNYAAQVGMANAGAVKVTAADKRGGRVLSVIFCILIVLIGIWCSVIFLVRHVCSEDVIDSVVKEIDLSRIEVGFLTEDGDKIKLAEYISDYADDMFPIPWSEDDVEELLNQKFIKNFAADKVNDYVRDLFYETGEGEIKASELERLLKKHEDDIYEITGIHLLEDDFTYMVEMMKQENTLENTALSVYRDENPGTFSLMKNLFSYWMLSLLLILVALLIFGIFLIQGKKLNGFCYLGISLVVTGVANLLTSLFIADSLAKKMERSMELGLKFWRSLFSPIQKASVSLGLFLTVPGVICILVYVVTKMVGNRTGKGEKMRATGN